MREMFSFNKPIPLSLPSHQRLCDRVSGSAAWERPAPGAVSSANGLPRGEGKPTDNAARMFYWLTIR